MKIGLRTIKTVIAATLGIIIANYIGLKFPATAGIIAILSVTNTKTSSFKVGFGRIIALFIAIGIAFVCYQLLGYNPIAFGCFLLVYIPIAARFNMSEAIPVNSVLITHFLNEGQMTMELVINAISLLFIGVGLALLANLYMPNEEQEIQLKKESVDSMIKEMLKMMTEVFEKPSLVSDLENLLFVIQKTVDEGELYAKKHQDNRLLIKDYYDISYFQMRRMQLNVLTDMVELIKEIEVEEDMSYEVEKLLYEIQDSYSELNDGVQLKEKVQNVYQYYETKALPKTREEFENRAKLYQLLTEIQTFIDIKVNFNFTE